MTPPEAYIKCMENNKRDKDLELIIITNPSFAYFYARDIIKDRWVEAENIISTDPECAFWYAREIIKDRWIEGENIISTNSYYIYLYAKHIIKGKLTENMHNAMILHADRYAKSYFYFIKHQSQ